MLAQTYGDPRTPTPVETEQARRFSIEGPAALRLVGDERGDAAGPSVLLLHGTGRSRLMWNELAPLLSDGGCHVVNVDLHGHGASDWSSAGDYSLDSFVADVLAICEQRGPFSAIIGTSLGAVASLLATAHAVTSVTDSLVLVDVEPTIESPDMHRIRAVLERVASGFESPREAYAALSPVPGLAHLGVQAHPPVEDGMRIDGQGRYHLKCDPRALDICQRPLGRVRNDLITQALAALPVPVLVVRGALPRFASEPGTRILASLPADAELVDLTSGTEWGVEPSRVLSSHVVEFVRRRTGRTATVV